VTKHLLDENDVLRLLHEVVDRAGGQSAWARRPGVDRATHNQVLRGKRHLPPAIMHALTLKKVVGYKRER
jgi:DNA-binding transcriptional regulator YdaS (Cro superfamily)